MRFIFEVIIFSIR